jgi:hypothetical protein
VDDKNPHENYDPKTGLSSEPGDWSVVRKGRFKLIDGSIRITRLVIARAHLKTLFPVSKDFTEMYHVTMGLLALYQRPQSTASRHISTKSDAQRVDMAESMARLTQRINSLN